jgi:hypothetical protein
MGAYLGRLICCWLEILVNCYLYVYLLNKPKKFAHSSAPPRKSIHVSLGMTPNHVGVPTGPCFMINKNWLHSLKGNNMPNSNTKSNIRVS